MAQTPLQKRLDDICNGGLLTGAITLGKKLGLFDALAQVSSKDRPASAKQVAEKANCKERYVREWLSTMGSGGLIQMTPEETFWIDEGPSIELVDAFKKEGPLGLEYAMYNDFYGAMDLVTQSMHGAHLISDYFPLIGMTEKLAAGGLRVLDVGCGSGFHARMMAKHFPKCHFTAIDISDSAIAMANAAQAKEGYTNLEYHVMDAGKMHLDWSDRFDFITIFDSCHDQMRPDLCIKEIHRLLKPGGLFAMLEIRGCSNAYEDLQRDPQHSVFFYAISMFHCLPVGSNSHDAMCMGAMWGEKRAKALLEKCGFRAENIQKLYPSFFPTNVVYLCKK